MINAFLRAALFAAGATALATPGLANPDNFPKDRTFVISYKGNLTQERRVDLKSGQTRYERSDLGSWDYKQRVFRVGDTIVVSLPDHQPGTVFAGGKEVIKAGHKAGIGAQQCTDVIYEGGMREHTCGRLTAARGGYRLETVSENGETRSARSSVTFLVSPSGCEIVDATHGSSEIQDENTPAMFPLEPHIRRETYFQEFKFHEGDCVVEAGRNPF